jgi:hypothetical protein
VYYMGNVTSTTFRLYTNPSLHASTLVNITANGSGTFSVITFDKPISYASSLDEDNPLTVILCRDGRVWWLDETILYFLGNTTLTSTGNVGRGIAIWKGYIIVFRRLAVDAFPLSVVDSNTPYASSWTYSFDVTISDPSIAVRPVLTGLDDVIYYADTNYQVSYIWEAPGETFDPTDSTTWNVSPAVDIPEGSGIYSLGELGQYLLIGTANRYIYPWDRISSSFDIPLIVPDYGTYRIESANNMAFLFCGLRGNIYVTNGSTVELYKKVPDSVASAYRPRLEWNSSAITQNTLYFSFTASANNSFTNLATTAGVWAIDLTTGVLSHTNTPSNGVITATLPNQDAITTVIIPNTLNNNGAGNAIFLAHDNSGTNARNGVDYVSSNLTQNYLTSVTTLFLTVGTFITPRTFKDLQVYIDRPMTSDKGVKLEYRFGQNDSWTEIGTFEGTDANYLNQYGFETVANIENAIILQLRASIKGATYFCIKEVILT